MSVFWHAIGLPGSVLPMRPAAGTTRGWGAGFRPRTTRGGGGLRGFGPARRGEEDCGVSPPRDEVLLFRQKNPKPVAPGRGPQEGVPVPRSLWCGLRNSLRSDSPRPHMEGTGPGRSPARRRREAVFVSSVMPGLIGHPASCHARSSIKNVMPDSDRASRGVFLLNKKGKAKALDPRVRKDDGEKRKDDHSCCHARLRSGIQGCFLFGIRKEKPRRWILACARMTEKSARMTEKKCKDDGEKHEDDCPFCHARLDRASRVLGLRCLERHGTTRRSSPTGSRGLRVGAVPARSFLLLVQKRTTLDPGSESALGVLHRGSGMTERRAGMTN